MTEDFVGTSGKLEEEFVYAPNNNLRTEVFVRFEQWAAQEKPLLLPGLMALKEKMGTYDFDKYIIEAAESMECVIRRFLSQGLAVEEVSKRTMYPVEFVEMLV